LYNTIQAQVTTTSQQLDGLSFKKGLKVGGSLSFINTFYDGSSGLSYREPYVYYLNAGLNINLWGMSMPFSFSYSNTGKSYTQPFNRFKLAPSYKWVRLHLGSSSLNYSKYTLAGHQFDGVGVELTPGKWYISAMYGRFVKAIEYDPLVDNRTTVAYKRTGYAAKVSYADKGDSYEATFFSGKDHPNSLTYMLPEEMIMHPKQNTAVSVNVKKSFFKYFFVQAEYAFSNYNSEIRNRNGEKIPTNNIIDRIFGKEATDKYVDALNASAGFQNQTWGVSFRYERISPNYETLGGYYFTNDMENFTIAPNVKLWQGMLTLSGNFGLQYNNLDKNLQNDTRRVVGAANVSFSSGKAWMANLGYSNFSTYTRVKPTSYPYYTDALDSLNFYQVSQNFTGMVSYTFGEKIINSVSLNGSYQVGNTYSEDVNTAFSGYSNAALAYMQQFPSLALGWSCSANLNYCDAGQYNTLYVGPGLSVNKSYWKNKLVSTLSSTYNYNNINGSEAGSLINTAFLLTYTPQIKNEKLGKHSFSLNAALTNRFGSQQQAQQDDSGYEFLTTLTYKVVF
jgi:hypothetical protein